MNRNVNLIRNRLSLRPPQEESLTILSSLVEKLSLRKNSFPNEEEKQQYLSTELEKVKSTHPTCTDFERTFPSVCFALATGVGKTRLIS
ncbi:MAG: hypothetical protein ACYC6P_05350 [Ignavibacteriaceae bacterium]